MLGGLHFFFFFCSTLDELWQELLQWRIANRWWHEAEVGTGRNQIGPLHNDGQVVCFCHHLSSLHMLHLGSWQLQHVWVVTRRWVMPCWIMTWQELPQYKRPETKRRGKKSDIADNKRRVKALQNQRQAEKMVTRLHWLAPRTIYIKHYKFSFIYASPNCTTRLFWRRTHQEHYFAVVVSAGSVIKDRLSFSNTPFQVFTIRLLK